MKNKTAVNAVSAVCAIAFAFFAPCAHADDESATGTLDSLKARAIMLESQMNVLKPMSSLPHSKYRALYRRAQSQLNAVNQQIAELESAKPRDTIPPFTDSLDEFVPQLDPDKGITEYPVEGIPEKPILIGGPAPILPIKIEELIPPEDSEEEADNVNDDGEDGENDDDEEEEEPETEPHRRWLEDFLDRKMEGVSDSEQMRALYAAYTEAYSTLKADPACPADLLVEVSALCEQLKVAADLEAKAAVPPESQDVPDGGTPAGSAETDDDGDGFEEEDAEESAGTGENSTGDDDPGAECALPEDGTGGGGEAGWNGPYIDDPEVEDPAAGAAGGASASGGAADGGDVSGASLSDASKASGGAGSFVNPASGGGAPSKMSQFYGRSAVSGASGGSYATAGNYFGSGGTSADASIATNYVDDIPYDLLQWKYGGFKPPTNAVRSTVVVSDLRVNRGGFRFKWVRDIGAWGVPYEVPDALACFFVKNNAGEWVGGKFEWISSSRSTREFTNIRDGYHGWNLKDVPNPCEVAFLVFRKDGKRRSNIVVGLWQR